MTLTDQRKTTMNRLIRATISLPCLFAATVAFAHGKLVTSNPSNGTTLDQPPTELRLQFNEPVEAAFTTVKLLGPAAKEVTAGPTTVDKADPKTVTLAVPALPSGPYRAEWTMVGPDGHKMKGAVVFSVK